MNASAFTLQEYKCRKLSSYSPRLGLIESVKLLYVSLNAWQCIIIKTCLFQVITFKTGNDSDGHVISRLLQRPQLMPILN
jgi:hypothetical protein